MNNVLLSLENVSKSFKTKNNTTNVIDNISFDINKGDFIAIVGTSGCGKTTLLNIISDLDKSYYGNIKYNFNKYDIAYMMQDAALFPWLTIKDNAKLITKIKKINNDDYINTLIKRYDLEEFINVYPSSLSGGMKQRVSLIRTIASKPVLLLLDEPFAGLDDMTRRHVWQTLIDAQKAGRIGILIIATHQLWAEMEAEVLQVGE
jgi:NitT/TauT family transport system ATP-binding protein